MPLEENRQLEHALRALLEGVQLVCEADISSEQVDNAEALVREKLLSHDFETLERVYPASLVAYFVRRGVEVYERNEIWRPLGVSGQTNRAGQAFINALRRLGLSDFASQTERAGARRFVAPILIHGAFPSSVARQLVECLEEELRRGLVDGAEARKRLLRRSDITQMIKRPAVRLLDWCPDFADFLLEAVIEHIDRPTGNSVSLLPVHLQAALNQDSQRRKGLRRLKVPYVEFSYWSGIGPQLRGVEGANWLLNSAGRTQRIAADDCIDLEPARSVSVTGSGRSIEVWSPAKVNFFALDERPVPADTPLPNSCVVLLPVGWHLTTAAGNMIIENGEGALLTGPWSNHRSLFVNLAGEREILAGPSGSSPQVRRLVSAEVDVSLVATYCDEACRSDGSPVLTKIPALVAPHAAGAPIRVRFTAAKSAATVRVIEQNPTTSFYELDGAIPSGVVHGTLEILGSTPASLQITIVPELTVTRPTRMLAPTDLATVEFSYITPRHGNDTRVIQVPAHSTEVSLQVLGLESGTIVVPLPRVLWSLRTISSARLDFADGVVRINAVDLIKEPMWLYARTGIPSSIGAALFVNGREHQVIQARPTARTTATAHFRSISLEVLRDSIRSNSTEHLEIRLHVSGEWITALTCGDSPVQANERAWSVPGRNAAVGPDNSALERIEWIRPGDRAEYDQPGNSLLASLRQADAPDAIVTFLRSLGIQQRNWKVAEFPRGRSADEWKHFDDAAHALWSLSGVRHREFSGRERERLRKWASGRREQYRRAPEEERRGVQEWLLRSSPDLSLLPSWPNGQLVRDALPSRSDVTSEWLPATVLYHVLALVSGDEVSGLHVEESVKLAPKVTLEAVAFVLQTLLNGTRIFDLPPAPAEADDIDAEATSPEAELPTTLETFDNCEIAVKGRMIVIATLHHCSPPVLRLIAHDRAVALVGANGSNGSFEVEVPLGISGALGLQLVDPRSVPLEHTPMHEVDVSANDAKALSKSTRVASLRDLATARLDDLTVQIAVAAAGGHFARGAVEELFADERTGARALLRMKPNGQNDEQVDLALISCLPAAMLFSTLGFSSQDFPSNPLGFAVLGPRDAASWQTLLWPDAQTFHSGRTWTNLAGYIKRLGPREPMSCPTFRYTPAAAYPNPSRLAKSLEHAERQKVDPAFLDLVIATHRLINVDQLAEEALRMLLNSYREHPRPTRSAVIAGIATTLACAVSPRTQ